MTPFKPCAFIILALGFFLSASLVSAQESTDPSEVFLRAYMLVQQGEKLEKSGKSEEALKKLRSASNLLQQIRQDNPNWQPLIVQYRTQKTSEFITSIDRRLASEAGSRPPSSRPPANPPANPDSDLPPLTDIVPQNPRGSRPSSGDTEYLGGNDLPSNPSPPETVSQAPRKSSGPGVMIGTADTQQIKVLQQKVQQLEKELSNSKEALESAHSENSSLKTEAGEANAKLAAAMGELETAKADLARAKSEGEQSTTQIADLNQKLTEATAQVEQGKVEKEAILAEKEALNLEKNDILAKLETAQETLKKSEGVLAENADLLEKLRQAGEKMASLSEEPTKLREQIAAAKTELEMVKTELSASQDAQSESVTVVAGLRDELSRLNTQLESARAASSNPEELTRVQGENDLLRNIVVRQLKEEARREQARHIVMEEISKVEGRSDILMKQLGVLSEPVIHLTEQERGLFKTPTVVLSDTETDNMAMSIALGKPVETADTDLPPTVAASPAPAAEALPDATPAETGTGGGTEVAGTPTPASSDLPEGPTGVAATPNTGSAPVVEVSVKPKVPEELIPIAKEARQYFDRGQYRQAEQSYQKLLARAPNNLYGLSNLGVVLFRSGKLKQAELTFKKAVTVAPDDAFSQATLGIVYYSLEKFDDAITALTKALTLDPKNAQAHNYLGITASQKGWQDAAEEELQKAIMINPGYADAHFNLAVLYATEEPPKKELAKRHYEKAVQLGSQQDQLLEKLVYGQ